MINELQFKQSLRDIVAVLIEVIDLMPEDMLFSRLFEIQELKQELGQVALFDLAAMHSIEQKVLELRSNVAEIIDPSPTSSSPKHSKIYSCI